MSLSPELLLCSSARKTCVTRLRELPSFISKGAKHNVNASVLVPLCVENNEVCLLYTLRSSNLNSHGGQVSFPGGKMDDHETFYETALRETEEEIGISRENVDIWSEMSQIQGRNKDIAITPVVGLIRNFSRPALQPNTAEVQEIFTVSMKTLCDTNNHAHFKYESYIMPVYLCGKHKIWGITGMITHFFLQCFLSSKDYSVDFMRKKFEFDELMPAKL